MESKREQAKRKLAPIIEKALDPMGRDHSCFNYVEANRIATEIVDLMMACVAEELREQMYQIARGVRDFDGRI